MGEGTTTDPQQEAVKEAIRKEKAEKNKRYADLVRKIHLETHPHESGRKLTGAERNKLHEEQRKLVNLMHDNPTPATFATDPAEIKWYEDVFKLVNDQHNEVLKAQGRDDEIVESPSSDDNS